jgi:hypothetical protein
MSSEGALSEDRQLWQRWRALGETSRTAEPDALSIAAYAEGRLSESEAEPIEAWLAASPEAVDDIVAARAYEQRPPRVAFEHVLAHACELIPGTASTPAVAETATATILPFRRRLAPQWRTALAWSSVAASLVCASMVGFSMGSAAYTNLSGTQTVDTAVADGLDTSPNLDSYFSDDSGT